MALYFQVDLAGYTGMLITEEGGPANGKPGGTIRWVAFLAAAVEWLCARDRLSFPSWTGNPELRLSEPWFIYPGWRLRAWQLADTPAAFKARNIFGGDRILDRV